MPVRATVCGDAAPLSATLSFAEYAAAAAGLNATYTVQVPLAASVGPQVSSATKSVGLVPANVIEVIVTVVLPELVSVTALVAEVVPCAVAGKARLVTLSFTLGAATPVPVSVTFCGEPVALSVTLNVAVFAAAVAGLKAT